MLASFEYLQSDAHARVGTRVGHWMLERLLGVGGMAAVYAAGDEEGNVRALKIVHQKLLEDEKVFRRLRREAQVMRRLAHPGIVTVHDVCRDDDGSLYLVMDLLDGHSFDAVRRRVGGVLTAEEVRWSARELLHVLATAHGQEVLHRDIKPSNVFLTAEGALTILDFGVARSTGGSSGAVSLQTLEGSVLGTPTFMSPEQARGRWSEVDERSDLWSVGATLFTLASGRPVHEARNATEALGLAMTAPARGLLSVRPDFDPGLAAIIDRSLQYNASERWPHARAMFEALGDEQYVARREQVRRPELVRRVEAGVADVAPASDPSMRTTVGHTTRGRARVAAALAEREVSAIAQTAGAEALAAADAPDSWHLLKRSQYWELHEIRFAKIVVLRRTGAVISSTSQLRQENLEIAQCLELKHQGWGGVVDMRQAPARNDVDFEDAMRFLRHRLSNQLSRLSVLVSSAAGLLQVSRIDRVDGTTTHVTQNEKDAIRYAEGG